MNKNYINLLTNLDDLYIITLKLYESNQKLKSNLEKLKLDIQHLNQLTTSLIAN